jgi:hypothetical protein
MISRTFQAGGHTGRLFARVPESIDDDAMARATSEYQDAEDVDREPYLREALTGSTVRIDAHFGVDPRDVLHVFVQTEEGPLFACVIVSENRADQMLEQSPVIHETYSFQIANGTCVTKAAATAAFEHWVERNFPDMPLPRVRLLRWMDEPFLAMSTIGAPIGSEVMVQPQPTQLTRPYPEQREPPSRVPWHGYNYLSLAARSNRDVLRSPRRARLPPQHDELPSNYNDFDNLPANENFEPNAFQSEQA